jgi:NADH:ubiquinone reductase (H+-translocating)
LSQRVIILGGGFGGLYAALALKRGDVDVTLIDRRNFHLFQPLMYQVATGSLSPADISAPLRGILSRQKNTRVLMGEAADLDPHARRLTLKDGATFDYDFLLVATGSQTSYYGHDQWKAFAPSLKTIEEATAIRHKILYAFEAAERAADPELRRAWLNFAIVGAGATGVELAGALGEIARHTLKHDFRAIRSQDAQIFLLDGSRHVLPSYPEDLATDAERSLTRLGVQVRTGVHVEGMDANGVTFRNQRGDSETLAAKTVLWAGGVAVTSFGRTLAERTQAPTDKEGRIRLNPDLTVPKWPEIYVVGDLAGFDGPDGKQLPGVAQVAMQGGAYAARAIVARLNDESKQLPPFRYFDKGDLAVIGRGSAVARIFGAHLSGLLAWLVWLFVHLMYLVQFQNRVIVFVQWGFQYITFSRGARLITGDGMKEE